MSREFLPIQVIYEGETKRYLPTHTFPASFDSTFSEKHWSSTEKSLSFFNKIVFPCFKNVRKAKGYPDEQMGFIKMDAFKEQDHDEAAKLCHRSNCALIIVPHNLTNKIQPLIPLSISHLKVLQKTKIICGMLNRLQNNSIKVKLQQT